MDSNRKSKLKYSIRSRHSKVRNRSRSPSEPRSTVNPSSSRFVCIQELPSDIDVNILKMAISERVGPFVFVRLFHRSGSSSAKALIEFNDEQSVSMCLEMMDRIMFYGRILDVREVKDLDEFLRKNAMHESLSGTERRSDDSTSTDSTKEEKHSPRYRVSSWDTPGSKHAKTKDTKHEDSLMSRQSYGEVSSKDRVKRDSQTKVDDPVKVQIQSKLWSSVWKTRAFKKADPDVRSLDDGVSKGVDYVEIKPETVSLYRETIASTSGIDGNSNSTIDASNEEVTSVAVDIMTGVFHIRRALETIRRSKLSHDAFRTSALFLRRFNEELVDWKDMYFSREESNASIHSNTRLSLGMDEKERKDNSVEIQGDDNEAISLFMTTTIAYPMPIGSSWFMIGPAQPRYSNIAAIRRNALPSLMHVSREKVNVVLAQFANVASPGTLSHCIRTLTAGGYIDFDWFQQHHSCSDKPKRNFSLSVNGLSYSNWYRCFELILSMGEMIAAPGEYLTSLSAYRHVVEVWWRKFASVDLQTASITWTSFYELFDKSWRMYASRSPEYRTKLHIFDAWWVFHRMDPTAQKLRVPLPPYDVQLPYIRHVALHYQQMLKRPIPSMTMNTLNVQRFDTGVASCSMCGDCDHVLMINGPSSELFCPFASRRIAWCSQMYEGVCEDEICIREGRHVCAHCGNPGRQVMTCPNCKMLVT